MVNLKNAYTLYRRKCLLRWVAKNIGQKQVFILDAQELETLFILKMHLHCCQISDCRAYNVATLHWDYLIALLPAAATTDAPGRDQCSLWEQKTLSKMGAWVGNVECGNVQRVARTTDRQLCGRGWAGGLQAYNFYYSKGVVDVRIQMRICRVALCPVFFFNEYAKRRRRRRQRLPVCDFISDTPPRTKESLHATAAATVAKQLQCLTTRVCVSL